MSIIDSLPPDNSPERDSLILEGVADGLAEYAFVPVSSKYNNHTATFKVFNDALKIEGVRINVSAEGEQNIADLLNCLLLTAKLADMIFMQAGTVITPKPRTITSSTKAMIAHSNDIDKALAGSNTGNLISTVGKHWLIENDLVNKPKGTACNYGWHFKGQSFQGIHGDLPVGFKEMPNVHIIQSRGYHHNKVHNDYSQTCVLVDKACVVDGKAMDLEDVLSDPELSFLANYSGKMKVVKQL